jgi:hypothetical protein
MNIGRRLDRLKILTAQQAASEPKIYEVGGPWGHTSVSYGLVLLPPGIKKPITFRVIGGPWAEA